MRLDGTNHRSCGAKIVRALAFLLGCMLAAAAGVAAWRCLMGRVRSAALERDSDVD